VLLDVFWGIDGTKEVAMQVEDSLRHTPTRSWCPGRSVSAFCLAPAIPPGVWRRLIVPVLALRTSWAYADRKACPAIRPTASGRPGKEESFSAPRPARLPGVPSLVLGLPVCARAARQAVVHAAAGFVDGSGRCSPRRGSCDWWI
jgi:hypothetical protein